MAQQAQLFFDGIKENPQSKTASYALVAGKGKKTAKVETPVEKEMRKFNKMIQEINQHQEDQKKKQQEEDEYHKLYHTKVIPAFINLATEKLNFLKQLHVIFTANTYARGEQRAFVEFVLSIVQDIAQYNEEAHSFATFYMNLNVALMTKVEKKHLKNHMEETLGFDIDMDNYDAEKIFEQQGNNASGASYQEEDGEDGFDFEEAFFKTPPPKKKKANGPAPEEIELQALYKELAKQIHPDLEPNESLKHEKQLLMQELVKARKEHNLFMMLLIKSKAHQINGTKSHTEYSLDKLKLYNKQLKRKLDEMKDEIAFVHFSSLFMNNGRIDTKKNDDPEERVGQELKDVKKQLKSLKKDMEAINSHDMLKQFIQRVW